MPTRIEWTDEVWNPVTGCTKISSGCANCYAEREFPRAYSKDVVPVNASAGITDRDPDPARAEDFRPRKFSDVQTHPERLEIPLAWRKPRMVFTCSMGDLFHEKVPDYFIDAVFAVMGIRNVHTGRLNTFQVLTKRHHRMQDYMEGVDPARLAELAVDMAEGKWGPVLTDFSARWKEQNGPVICADFEKWPLPNIWMGVSVEDQENDERIRVLLETPAAVRFVSLEPMLGPIDLGFPAGACPSKQQFPDGFEEWSEERKDEWFKGTAEATYMTRCCCLDWVIVGGESGPKARPMHPDWARSIRDQCHAVGVPFFFKQGSAANWSDFKDYGAVPKNLRIREFPGGKE